MVKRMWRDRILDYLRFSKSERRGIFLLLLVISCIWLIPFFFSPSAEAPVRSDWELVDSKLDSLSPDRPADRGQNRYRSLNFRRPDGHENRFQADKADFFIFDPNTASESDWMKLGLPARQVRTIRNYLSKGGRFRKPEDLRRIYGFPDEAYQALLPYVRIRDDAFRQSPSREDPKNVGSPGGWNRKNPQHSISKVGINSADSTQWEALPGIGPGYARRIMLFRNKLGGFHDVMQVGETFGLPDSTFQKILPYLEWDAPAGPVSLNLNSATVEELQSHPYVSYRLAKVLVAYRTQHGPFQKPEEILRIALVTPELYKKLSPYLKIN